MYLEIISNSQEDVKTQNLDSVHELRVICSCDAALGFHCNLGEVVP